MKKKKIVTLCLVIALVATMVAGGTLAYFTDSDEATNVFAIGKVDIELSEEVGTSGNAKVKVTETGATYTGVTPGDKLQKEVKIANTGSNAAYVQVAVTLKNSTGDWANLVNKAIDEKYGDAAAQAWYDKVFVGFGLNHSKDLDGDGTSDAGMRLTITGDKMPDYVLHVDSTKTLTDYSLFYTGNWFGAEKDIGAFDQYHTTGMGKYELKYVYYLYLEPGQESVLFEGLNVPYEFDEEQMKMFEKLTIAIDAKAIQASGFEGNPKAAFTALNGGEVNRIEAGEKLEDALNSTTDTIITIELTQDTVYDVSAHLIGAMGTTATERIVINGNGHTLTFNHTNGDWNNITTNGATLVLNNVHLTNTGKNNGPWNRHDLNFGCDVELNNVTSDKAMAFKADAKLNNVKIADKPGDIYAIWIQPNGQKVSIDGLTVDCSRGIKIDEQYVSSPAAVDLTVKNATFKTTGSKAAILVKCAAGANITVENVNITGCAADSTNAVWVDDAAAASFDLVNVTGATKILEH